MSAENHQHGKDLSQVQETIAALEDRGLVRCLAREPGRKEPRYAHLLSGESQATQATESPLGHREKIIVGKEGISKDQLQEQIDQLRLELQELKEGFENFKKQFGP